MIISFDFDQTLADSIWEPSPHSKHGVDIYTPKEVFLQLLKEYHALGLTCIILTARMQSWDNRTEIENFLHENEAHHCVKKIVFSNLNLKGEYAKREGVILHYDDDQDQIADVRSFGIIVIDSLSV